MRQRAYGPGHWEVGQTLYNLGVLYHYQGDLKRVEPFYRRALGPGHPDLADTLDNYADILSATRRRAAAARLKPRAARIRSQAG